MDASASPTRSSPIRVQPVCVFTRASSGCALPMLGRPAMMMKSDGWKPEVSRSSFSKPVATPVTCSFRS